MELTKQAAETFEAARSNSNEGASAFPLQQDLLVASDYFDNLRVKAQLEPEKELLLAVLQDGILCFRDNVHACSEEKTALREEARAWIFNGDSGWLFSFLSICDLLDMDPEYVRQALKHWEEHGRNLTQEQRRHLPPARPRLVA
jgi:hypothetical protein